MFKLTGTHASSEPVFSTAARYLGSDPRDWIRTASACEMQRNRTAQILCVTQALAAYRIVHHALPVRTILVGYSVGQMATWCIAGLLDEDAILALTVRRAELMDSVSTQSDGMAFVRGLTLSRVEAIARQHGVEIAIVNPGNGYVVGGRTVYLDAFGVAATAGGAQRFSLLPVRVASHTSRFAKIGPAFRDSINAARPLDAPNGIILLDGIEGTRPLTLQQHVDALTRQVAERVRWDLCLEAAREHGATAFLELGPGRALADMAASTYSEVPAHSVDDFTTAVGLERWVREVVARGR